MATQSYDNLLTAEGPPQPDYELLDLCSETLNAIKQANDINRIRETMDMGPQRMWTDEHRARWVALSGDFREWDAKATRLLRRVSKLKATTAAGLYAKALVCRSSASGSAVLAHSLAEDFLACEGLRSSLWPAAGGG